MLVGPDDADGNCPKPGTIPIVKNNKTECCCSQDCCWYICMHEGNKKVYKKCIAHITV